MGSVAIFKGKLVKFLAKAGILVPARPDADRSLTPTAGETAFNTTANKLEVYDGTGWTQLGAGGITGNGLVHPNVNSTYESNKANPSMTGADNTAIGVSAGNIITSGFRNVFYGFSAGSNLSSGNNNVGLGVLSLSSENIGNNNVAIGNLSLGQLGNGSYNVGIGPNAGQLLNVNSNYNTFVNTEGFTVANTVNGTVAIGKDSTGNNALVTADNDFVLGTANHRYKLPGIVKTGLKVGQSTNDTSYVTLQSNTTGSPVTWTLPVSNGSSGQVLTTSGISGILSWSTPTASLTGPIYSRSATGTATKIYGKTISDALAIRAISTWTAEKYWPTTITANSVCWSPELGIFVSVGSSGTLTRAATSTDGLTWIPRLTPENNSYSSVCWSPTLGLFCAVSTGGTNRVMTSPDGINWTARAASSANSWRSVCWSSELGRFVAVSSTGSTDRAMYSSDGITWTAATTSNLYSFYSVCWSPELGIFCAFAGGAMMTSSDGITWSTTTTSVGLIARGTIVWSAELGIFCTSSDTSTGFATSTNGTTWTARTAPNANSWSGLAWSSELGLFCTTSVTGIGTRVATSPDGITWTVRTSATDNQWPAVCWSPELGIFCAVSSSASVNNGAMISRDIGAYKERKVVPKYFYRVAQASESNKVALRWTGRASTAIDTSYWPSSCWSPELKIFVAVASNVFSGTNRIATSIDGITWTTRTTPAATNWNSVCWSPELSLFCAVGGSGSTTNDIMTSPDGINWTLRTRPTTNALNGICWSPELTLFVAVGSNKIVTSPDGITWTDRTSPSIKAWNSVCWSPELGTFCAVSSSTGDTVTIMTSVNGTSWSTQNAPDIANVISIKWIPEMGIFLANTNNTISNHFISSKDGTTWSGITVPSQTLNGVQFFAASSFDSFEYSPELKTIVGTSSDFIYTSVDGINFVMKTRLNTTFYSYTMSWSPELGIFIFLSFDTNTNAQSKSYVSRQSNILSEILNLKSNRLY